jgi:hypothetical protein
MVFSQIHNSNDFPQKSKIDFSLPAGIKYPTEILLKFQATFPLLLQLIVLVMLVNMNYKIIGVQLSFYTFILLHWLPLLNPVASILTNRPYREAVTRKLRLCSSSTTTAINVLYNSKIIHTKSKNKKFYNLLP